MLAALIFLKNTPTFFVNDEEATAENIRALIAEAWNSVRERFEVEMELEVELVGDWEFEQ